MQKRYGAIKERKRGALKDVKLNLLSLAIFKHGTKSKKLQD